MNTNPSESIVKRESLSDADLAFITTHAVLPEWTDDKIAEKLNCSSITIKKTRQKLGVKRGPSAVGIRTQKDNAIQREAINKANISDDEKVELWKKEFSRNVHYKRWTKEFTPEDLEYFMDQWAQYHLQFSDLKPSEEKDVEALITLDLRISDIRKSYKSTREEEERIKELLGNETNQELDMENEETRGLHELVHATNRMQLELNKELRELNRSRDILTRALNATREQREQHEKIGAETFNGFVKALTSKELRKKAGEFNEIMKLSKQAKEKELKEPHEFIDGEVDRILLDGDDFIKENNE